MKILLVTSVAIWGFAGSLLNVIEWNSNTLDGVRTATTMSTFEGGSESWRATSSPIVVWLGAIFIALSKLAAGILCCAGAVQMWRARHADALAFNHAKQLALAGCGVAMFMLFLGFIVVADTWFELWRSDWLRSASLQSAFRYGGMITLIALFVGMKDES